MSGLVRLRTLTPRDLGFADSLRSLAGWNQTASDWQRFVTFDPQGAFVAESNSQPAGVVATMSYGTELAWIGMLLVHPDYRRRGIGRALLQYAIDYLRSKRIRTIKLDATPQGESTYARSGFRAESTLTRWEGVPAVESASELETWDTGAVEQIDLSAFGAPRVSLLDSLAQESRIAVRHAAGGYGMLRPGARAVYLGPVVAPSADIGLEIAAVLLAEAREETVFWDILDCNPRVAAWAQAHGFKPQRQLTRMFLGESNVSSRPEMQFAIAGPELG